MKLKDQLHNYVDVIGEANAGITNPDRKDNVGALLFNAYIAQELCSYSEQKLKKAWLDLQDSGLVPSDDKLRDTEGQILLEESNHFSAIVEVSAPSSRFDKETFIAEVARKFKLPTKKLEALAETCVKASKASLKKRILEV